jgi:hypothetical protein
VQQPVAGRGDEGRGGPQPVGAALGAAMVDLLARSDPAEQAAGRGVGTGQEVDHGGAEGGPDRLRPSWSFVAASGDWLLH